MTHNPSNPNCDKNQYAGADGVRCTCDVDTMDDVPVPSTVERGAQVFATHAVQPGSVVLSGRRAATHAELEAALRELHAAESMLKPAQERWKRALDAHAEALLKP